MEDRFQDRDGIFDTAINDYVNTEDIVKLLNNVDKRIKELEQENLFLKEQNKSLIDEEEHISKKMQEVGFDNVEDLCSSQKQVNIVTVDSSLTVNNSLVLSDEVQPSKVYIWGYELCIGSQWNDFLEVVNKLGEENKSLKKHVKQVAITKLNKLRQNLIRHSAAILDVDGSFKEYAFVIKDTDFERFIDDTIEELKGE